MPMNNTDKTLKDYMLRFFKQLDMTDLATEVEVEHTYRRLVGTTISNVALRYHAGTLYLTIITAALRQELNMRRTSLMQRINEELGKTAVKRIVVK